MRTPFGSLRNRHASVAACFLGTLLTALFLPVTGSAAGEQKPGATTADQEASPPSSGVPKPEVRGGDPRWTVSLGAVVLGRTGGVNQTLVARVPGAVPFSATSTFPGTEAFNNNQFQRGFAAGPKIGLIYRDDSGHGVELTYFNIG